MASAGVVGMAEVVTPSSAPSSGSSFGGSPAMWAYVWVGFAALILMFMHMALIGRGRR